MSISSNSLFFRMSWHFGTGIWDWQNSYYSGCQDPRIAIICYHYYYYYCVCVSSQIFQLCGDVEGLIAMETLQMEVEVENRILQHLKTLVEVDVPSIQKLRKQLTSRTLDMDSARAR